jgi:hypothetical protein
MSKRIHTRFWADMIDRFGRRWAELYGPVPGEGWTQLLDRFEPSVIKSAVASLASLKAEFPPTMPQFETLLLKAEKAERAADDRNWIRDFWRTVIVDRVSWQLGYSFVSFEPVLIRHRYTLGAAMLELLNSLEEQERTRGYRTDQAGVWAVSECDRIARNHVPLKALRAVA